MQKVLSKMCLWYPVAYDLDFSSLVSAAYPGMTKILHMVMSDPAKFSETAWIKLSIGGNLKWLRITGVA